MITEFNKLAVIDALPYAGSEGSLPATLYVETGYGFDEPDLSRATTHANATT